MTHLSRSSGNRVHWDEFGSSVHESLSFPLPLFRKHENDVCRGYAKASVGVWAGGRFKCRSLVCSRPLSFALVYRPATDFRRESPHRQRVPLLRLSGRTRCLLPGPQAASPTNGLKFRTRASPLLCPVDHFVPGGATTARRPRSSWRRRRIVPRRWSSSLSSSTRAQFDKYPSRVKSSSDGAGVEAVCGVDVGAGVGAGVEVGAGARG